MDENGRFLEAVSRLPSLDDSDLPGSVRQRRRALAELFDAPAPRSVAAADETIAGVPVRVFAGDPGTTIVYAHGGGWVAGDPGTHAGTCERLAAQTGSRVVSVDYRRPPEHPHPAAVDDVAAVVQAVSGQVVLAGDSSGAHIAFEAAALGGNARVVALVLLQPACDPELRMPSWTTFGSGYFLTRESMRWFWDTYAAGRRLPALWDRELGGLPPTLVVLAQLDPSFDEGAELVRRLSSAGVSVDQVVQPNALHGSLTLPGAFPSQLGTFDVIAQWIGELGNDALPGRGPRSKEGRNHA